MIIKRVSVFVGGRDYGFLLLRQFLKTRGIHQRSSFSSGEDWDVID